MDKDLKKLLDKLWAMLAGRLDDIFTMLEYINSELGAIKEGQRAIAYYIDAIY
jgi:hypothetical protein